MLRNTASKTIWSRPITAEPQYIIINQLRRTNVDESVIFTHKIIQYFGKLTPLFDLTAPTLVRMCIVQPHNPGGQEATYDTPTSGEVFGTESPSVATPINESLFWRISDRHYLVYPDQEQRLNYFHRLTNNLSYQLPTVGKLNIVHSGPMFLCIYMDHTQGHISLSSFEVRTTGYVATMPLDFSESTDF